MAPHTPQRSGRPGGAVAPLGLAQRPEGTMAKNGFKVFDSDMHVLEPVDLWERYIDPAFRDRAPRGSTHTPMDVGVVVGGENAFRLSAAIAKVSFKGGLGRFADDIARGFDAKA